MTTKRCRYCSSEFGLMPVGRSCVMCALVGKDGRESQARAVRVHTRACFPTRFYGTALQLARSALISRELRARRLFLWADADAVNTRTRIVLTIARVERILSRLDEWTDQHVMETTR